MAQIKKNEIIESGLFEEEIKNAMILKKELEELTKQMSDLLKASKESISKATFGDVESIKKFNDEVKKAKIATTEKEKIDKQILQTEEKIAKATDKQNRLLIKRREELKALNQQTRREERATAELGNEYDKQSATLNLLVKRYQNLAAAERQNSKEGRQLLKDITKLDTKLKNIDATVGRNQRNVGNYASALGGLKKQFRSVANSAGLAFGAVGAFGIIKDGVKVVRDFERSLSSLEALLGATAEEMAFFRSEARKIGSDLDFSTTAAEAVKAFELVGSAQPELLKNRDALVEVTRDALTLADAANIDVTDAVKSLTGTLNQFELGAEGSSRAINAIAAGSQAGAAPITAISESLDKFGAIAAGSNISVEESIGLIETLAEKNIQGAEAGTKLRNALTTLNTIEALPPKALADLERLGVNLDIVSDISLPVTERLEELGKISKDSTALVRVFGKENQLAGQILLENTDKIEEYTEAVTDTNTAQEQAAAQANNLDGDLKKLSKTWESVVLGTDEATGANDKLRAATQFLTENLDTIIDLVIKLTVAYAGWRTALFAVRRARDIRGFIKWVKVQRESLLVTKLTSAATATWSTITGLFTGKLKLAALAQRAFGLATKVALGPIGLIAAAIGGLIALFSGLSSASAKAAEEIKRVEKSLKDLKETEAQLANKFLKDISDNVDLVIKKEEQRLATLKAQGASRAKLAAEELKSLEVVSAARRSAIDEIQTALNNREADIIKEIQDLNETAIAARNEIEDLQNNVNPLNIADVIISGNRLIELKQSLKLVELEIKNSQDRLRQNRELANKQINEFNQKSSDEAFDNEIKRIEQQNKTRLQILKDRLAAQQKLLERSLNSTDDAEKDSFIKLKNRALATKKEIEELTALLSLAEKKREDNAKRAAELEKQAAKERETIRKIDIEVTKRELDRRDAIIETELEKTISTIRSSGEVQRQELDKQIELLFKQRKQVIEDERDFLLSNEKLTALERELIIEQANTKLEQLRNEELEFTRNINNEILDTQKDAQSQELEARKKLYDNLNMVADAFAERERRRTQKAIDDINKEIAARESRVTRLQELADKGSSDAAKTIANEEKRIAELERKKLQQEKRQRRAELFLTTFKTFSANLDDGQKPTQAAGNTIASISLLSEFIRNLPAFEKGTENTSSTQNVDGKGGFHAILHQNERVMDAENNAKTVGLSNTELADLGDLYKRGLLVPSFNITTTQVPEKGVSDLTKSFNDMKNEIVKMKSERHFQYDKTLKILKEVISDTNGIESRASKVRS